MVSSVALRPPYEKLPNELLVRIFRLAGGASVAPGATRHIIGHVCKSWRQVSRSTRSLWSEIVIQVDCNDDVLTAWRRPEVPDVSLGLVQQCLILSKTYPLDIRIVLVGELDSRVSSFLSHPISLLLTNSFRWRTFTCIGPASVLRLFNEMDSFESETLEAVTLRCTEGVEFPRVTQSDVTFSSSLRYLDVNFDFPQLKPQWDKITSLRMGFTTPLQCHNILSQMTNLASLHLIHIGDSQSASAHHTPILLHNLRQLKLSACAINKVLDDLRLPNLEQLYLTQPQARGEEEEVAHTSHNANEWTRCPNNSSNVVIERISRLLRDAVVPLRVLDVAWAVSLDVLLPVMRHHCSKVTTLRVQLRPANVNSAPALLDALVASTQDSILPNLSEFSLGFHRCRDTIFTGQKLERMVRSRWYEDTYTKSLRRLHLWGDLTSIPSYPKMFTEVLREYTVSSLSLTLQEFAEEGFDVEWIFEGEDILEEGRRQAQLLR